MNNPNEELNAKPTFQDMLRELESIRTWEHMTDTDARILDLIESILNRLILEYFER